MPSPSGSLRVAVVEDQPLFREMLTGMLRGQPGMTVVMSAGSVASARSAFNSATTDVALVDVELPDGNGLELGQMFRRASPRIGIVLLSAQDVMATLLSLPTHQRSGWSYLSKSSSTSSATLVRALRISADGRAMLDPDLVESSSARSGSPLTELTTRQFDALGLLAIGLSNGAIAKQLNISTHSVENLLNSVYAALGLANEPSRNRRVSAVVEFLKHSARPGRAAG